MQTYSTKAKDIKRKWHLIDLEGKVLGRSASIIAQLLIGKKKVYFVPYLDCGDYVVAINAAKVKVTGRKYLQKKYQWHSGYPGGLKQLLFKQMMARDPRKIIERAVSGMLPKNKLKKLRLKRFKVFIDDKHPYEDKLKTQSSK